MIAPDLKPLGDEHLELRAGLGTSLFSLITTAQELDLGSSALGEVHRCVVDLQAPFSFVVAGEVKAGKSALLNALFGSVVCTSGVLPVTDRVHLFKYEFEPSDRNATPTLVEHGRPVNFLRDFHLVDTPGTNSLESEHTHIAEEYLPVADAVFFVFPVTNPWGATAWTLIERVQTEWRQRLVIVVQQCDLREPAEVQLITEHLRKLCREKLGAEIPVFAVSAKKALLAKTSGVDKPRLWQESGFGPFEEHVNALIRGDPLRASRLRRGLLAGTLELGAVRERTDPVEAVLAFDRTQLLATIGRMRAKLRDQLQAVENIHDDFERALGRCWRRGELMLEEHLRPWRIFSGFFGRNREWRDKFRAAIEPALRAALARQVESAWQRMESEMRTSRAQLASMLSAWAEDTPRISAAARRDAADSFRERRETCLQALVDAHNTSLQTGAARVEMQAIFAESVGEYLARSVRPDENVGAALTPRLCEIGVENAVAALDQVMDPRGLGGSRRRSRIIDAYHVAMNDRGAALARSVETIFSHLVETYYDCLIRSLASFEEFRSTEEKRWKPIGNRLRSLDERFTELERKLA